MSKKYVLLNLVRDGYISKELMLKYYGIRLNEIEEVLNDVELIKKLYKYTIFDGLVDGILDSKNELEYEFNMLKGE